MAPATEAPPRNGNEITKTEDLRKESRQLINRMQGEIAKALPKHLTAETAVRIATTTICQSWQLMRACVEAPDTVAAGVIKASELGLMLNGSLGQAYLIPRRNKRQGGRWEAHFQIGYKGLMDLAYRNSRIKTIFGELVYEADDFEYTRGLHPTLRHIPARKADKGPVIGAYVVCHMHDADPLFKHMWTEEIDAHRYQYSMTPDQGPWVDNWNAMALKTVFIQLSRWIPKSLELERAIALNEIAERGGDPSTMIDVHAGDGIDLPMGGGEEEEQDAPPENGDPSDQLNDVAKKMAEKRKPADKETDPPAEEQEERPAANANHEDGEADTLAHQIQRLANDLAVTPKKLTEMVEGVGGMDGEVESLTEEQANKLLDQLDIMRQEREEAGLAGSKKKK